MGRTLSSFYFWSHQTPFLSSSGNFFPFFKVEKFLFIYLFKATYLPPGKYQPGQEPIYFYSIDPVSGTGNKTLISQAAGLITGFVYNVKFDAIIFSTYKYDATYTNRM